jgi:hypothetical protein
MPRCVDGRMMRHDPQPDDPGFETDIGQCPHYEMGVGLCQECKKWAWYHDDGHLRKLLKEARQYVADTVGEEDMEVQTHSSSLLAEIDRALMKE